MWPLLALIILVVAVLVGCAVSLGSGSARVTTDYKTDIKREVVPDSATIEDVLSVKEKK